MIGKLTEFFKKGKEKELQEQKKIIEEIEEAVSDDASEFDEDEETDGIEGALAQKEEKEKKKAKGGAKGDKKKLIAVAVGAVLLVGGAMYMFLGEEDEDYYYEPVPAVGAPPSQGVPPAPGMAEGAGNPPPSPMPPPAVAQAGAGEQTFQPGAPPPSVPPSLNPSSPSSPPMGAPAPQPPPVPTGGAMPSPPPVGNEVASSPVVQQVQKRVVDNPFIINQVDRLVREAIQRILEEEREKIKKEIENLKGEKTLPSKGPITIGMPGESSSSENKQDEEVTIPSFTNAIVVSSIMQRGGDSVLLSNVGVIKKGLIIGDGWKVLEVGNDYVVLEKEYYELEGTKKVKKKKVEVVPFVFDFSVKPG